MTEPTTSGTNGKPDFPVLNNGVKLVGEAIVPGASLILEEKIGEGLFYSALGLLGSAALGSAFGPIGFVLGRYGSSAASFAKSIQPPPPKNGASPQAVTDIVTAAAPAIGEAVMRGMDATRRAAQRDVSPELDEAQVAAVKRGMDAQVAAVVRRGIEEALAQPVQREGPSLAQLLQQVSDQLSSLQASQGTGGTERRGAK